VSLISGSSIENVQYDLEENKGSSLSFFQPYDYDVQVDSVEILPYNVAPGVPSTTYYPGNPIGISAKVANVGTKSIAAPFEVLMVVVDDVSETDIKYNYQSKLAVNTLPSSGFTTLTFTWTPPEKPPRDADWDYETEGKHTFKIRVISLLDNDQNSSNNFNIATVDVKHPNFDLDITNRYWTGWGVTETNQRQITSMGGIVYLNFTVNETESSETNYVIVEYSSLPQDWVALPGSAPQIVEVSTNKGATVSMRVMASRVPRYALHQHDYYIDVLAKSLYSPLINKTFRFTVNVRYSPNAEFILPKDITRKPGEHLLNVTLKNSGNGRDLFKINTSIFPENNRGDWQAAVHSGWQSRILRPEETTEVTLKLTVPQKRLGSYKSIVVGARSVSVPSYTTGDDHRFKVYVGEYHGIKLMHSDEAELPVLMKPDDEYPLDILLTNTGNSRDPTIAVSVYDFPEGWEMSLDTSLIPSKGLGIGEQRTIGVLLKTPADVPAGGYSITIAGTAGEEGTVFTTLEIPVTIIEVENIIVTADPEVQEAGIGDIINYFIIIKNGGNWPDTYDIRLSYDTKDAQGWGKLSMDTVNLESGESLQMVLTVAVPLSAAYDANPQTPGIIEGYITDIIVTSWNKPTVSGSVEVTTNVIPYYDFGLSVDVRIKPVIAGNPEPVNFILSVENIGNALDTYEFESESDSNWARLLTKYSRVPEGQSRDVAFEVKVPTDIGAGVYDFNILVSSVNDQELFREITLKVYVSSLELSVAKLLVNGMEDIDGNGFSVAGGSSVLLTAQIKNTGTLAFESTIFGECELIFFDGRTVLGREFINYLPATGIMNITVEWTPPEREDTVTIYLNLDPEEEVEFSSRDNLSRSAKVDIRMDDSEGGMFDGPVNFVAVLLPIVIIILVLIVQVLSLRSIRQSKRSRMRRGYTASGEYRPYADIFFGEQKDLSPEVKRLFLPVQTKTVKTTKPVAQTRPLQFTTPVARKILHR
jgi:uncharacterized membrane protein